MTAQLPAELQDFVRGALANGTFRSEDELLAEAIRLLKERESLREDVRAGLAQLDRREVIDGDELFDRLRTKAANLAARR